MAALVALVIAIPLGMTFVQAAADVRTYAADPACVAGIAALPENGGGCGVGTAVVGGGAASRDGRYELSIRFSDGARREVPVSRRAYTLFRAPGTLVFVQVRQSHITLIGDERDVEMTNDHPARRIATARAAALAGFAATALFVTAAVVAARRDARTTRSNGAG